MSHLNPESVQKGFWVDNTRGSVLGQTITTDTQTGNIVIALMAVLTTIGIKRFWNLVLFLYHQMRVNNRPTDGLFRQQQALVRTLTGPASMLADWLKLWWVWRKRTDRAFLRSLPLVVLAVVFAAATVAVGIFVSYLVDSTNVIVLVSNPQCAFIDWGSVDLVEWLDYRNRVGGTTSQYAGDCYTGQTTTSQRCRIFTRPTIPSHQERVECPFEQSMCKNISLPGLAFDTGLLDLNEHLGLNLAAGDGMKFRRKATCAILELQGHYEVVNSSNLTGIDLKAIKMEDLLPDEEIMRINLGKRGYGNETLFMRYRPTQVNHVGAISIVNYTSWPGNAEDRYQPIQQLEDSQSDLRLTLMRFTSAFPAPVDDPLFSAHKIVEHAETGNASRIAYHSDNPISAFACQYQHQFCFTQSNHKDECTPLQSLPLSATPSDFPLANEVQSALTKHLVVLLSKAFEREDLPQDLTPGGLVQSPGGYWPNDFWVRQFTLFNNIALSYIQILLETYALGFTNLNLDGTFAIQQNATAAEKNLCHLQRMQSPGGFVNINVFALAFVSTFCVFITILDLVLLKYLVFSDRLRRLLAPRICAWIQDGVFQLQRHAYEGHNEGSWERLDKEVPATRNSVELLTLPLISKPLPPLPSSSTIALSSGGKSSSTTTVASLNPRSGLQNGQLQVTTAFPIQQDTAVNPEVLISPATTFDLDESPVTTLKSPSARYFQRGGQTAAFF